MPKLNRDQLKSVSDIFEHFHSESEDLATSKGYRDLWAWCQNALAAPTMVVSLVCEPLVPVTEDPLFNYLANKMLLTENEPSEADEYHEASEALYHYIEVHYNISRTHNMYSDNKGAVQILRALSDVVNVT